MRRLSADWILLLISLTITAPSNGAAMAPCEALHEFGLTPGFTKQQLKKAYRKRSFETHPDKPGGSHEAQTRVQKAHALLSEQPVNALECNKERPLRDRTAVLIGGTAV